MSLAKYKKLSQLLDNVSAGLSAVESFPSVKKKVLTNYNDEKDKKNPMHILHGLKNKENKEEELD